MPSKLLTATLALALAACTGEASVRSLEPSDEPGFSDWVHDDDETLTEDGDDDDDVPVRPELCDGRDNDQDGEVDEGMGGDDCILPDGVTGTTRCIAGVLKCTGCYPGDAFTVPCACGIERIDRCDDNGVLHEGVCDGCSLPAHAQPCGFCGTVAPNGSCVGAGECNPGDEMFVRCDSCPSGETCGSTTCVGEKLVCLGDCTWNRVEGCAIREPMCDQDSARKEDCGACGQQTMRCDGCFWEPASPCEEGGSCIPGTTRLVPCGDTCGEGFAAEVECTDACQWGEAGLCTGCAPGTNDTQTEECVVGHPACGLRVVETTCVASLDQSSCVASAGEPVQTGILNECPDIECMPGQIQPGTCDFNGQPVPHNQTCGNDCRWMPPPENCGGSCECTPGEMQDPVEMPCGCGQTMTVTTRCSPECKWEQFVDGDEDCPECQPGDARPPQECDAGCGMKSFNCTAECMWEASECEPKPTSCTPGVDPDITQPCQSECGTGQETLECVGCSWVRQGDCEPAATPECLPSQSVPRFPQECPSACVIQMSECDAATCTWTVGVCQSPCG